jgi:hypothetical protein
MAILQIAQKTSAEEIDAGGRLVKLSRAAPAKGKIPAMDRYRNRFLSLSDMDRR